MGNGKVGSIQGWRSELQRSEPRKSPAFALASSGAAGEERFSGFVFWIAELLSR
jgi:hypothetical protein